MMKNQRTIRELISDVTNELNRLKYSPLSIHTGYIIRWSHFLEYAEERGEQYFTELLGEKYLSERHGYPQNYNGKLPDAVKRDVRCIRILGDFQAHNVILRARKRVVYSFPANFDALEGVFNEYVSTNGWAEKSAARAKSVLKLFLWYIDSNGVADLRKVTANHISGFIASKSGYANATVCRDASALRSLLKFFYDKKLTDFDLSELVPKIRRLRRQIVPQYWDKETVAKLIGSVDRGSPVGKRDYAILLLITRLGIRSGDIMNLKLGNIYWDKRYIEFAQQKTGALLTLPLFNDIAESIVDYYKHGRPQTPCQNVFVKHIAPYNEFVCISQMGKYFARADICTEGRVHGLHSLRHSLASRLLEAKVDVITISEILGHSDLNTTNDYLHIDIDGLRKCAIDIEHLCEQFAEQATSPEEVSVYGR